MLNAFFLVGPTAVGKTAVAHELARRTQATLLSADSMLVYRGMDIGTAKATRAECEGLTYWGLDLVTPDQPFSVGDYLRAVQQQRGSSAGRVIVVGGTGLYVDALVRGLRSQPAADPVERARLEELHIVGGLAALQKELEQRAPGRLAELADPRNPRRVIRAIELAGQGILSRAMLERETPRPRLIGLNMEATALSNRIEERVRKMYAQGLLEEAASLRAAYPEISETARQAIGYAEAWAVLDGTMTRADAVSLTAQRTRQLAKRQQTWFRHQAEMTWVEANPGASVADTASLVEAQWEAHGTTPLQF